jgi:hypothetical protein
MSFDCSRPRAVTFKRSLPPIFASVSLCPTIGIAAKIHDMSALKQDVLRVLSELVEHCPDVRLGQLMVNLSCIARGPTPEAIWDMEDDELLKAVKSHLKDFENRHAAVR